MPAMLRVPTLAISPSEKPFQGKGKPDKILRNGRPNHSLADQLLKPGIGGHQTKVITKAFSREQKRNVGTSAALGAGITAAINPGTTKRAVAYGVSAGRLGVAGLREKDPAGKAQYLKDAKWMGGFAGRNAKAVGKPAAAWAGISAGVTAGSIAVNSRRQRVAKMSDVELRGRKKAAGHIAVTTSTMGLGSLAALGAGAALKKPRLTKVAATGSIVSGGVGGAGGYNFAAIQRAEAKRRPVAKAFERQRADWHFKQADKNHRRALISIVGTKKDPRENPAAMKYEAKTKKHLKKVDRLDATRAYKQGVISTDPRKRKVAKAFSPEGARHRRNKRQTQVAHGAGMVGAGGAGALVPVALMNNREGRGLKRRSFTQVQDGFKDSKTGTRSARKVKNSIGDFSTPFFRHPNVGERAANGGARGAKLVGLARKQGKGAAAFAALGVGGLVASDRIASYSSGKGQTYAPRHRRPE